MGRHITKVSFSQGGFDRIPTAHLSRTVFKSRAGLDIYGYGPRIFLGLSECAWNTRLCIHLHFVIFTIAKKTNCVGTPPDSCLCVLQPVSFQWLHACLPQDTIAIAMIWRTRRSLATWQAICGRKHGFWSTSKFEHLLSYPNMFILV